ncbi:MAG: CARDB domain-containing protein [Janthinobacterium lividum]
MNISLPTWLRALLLLAALLAGRLARAQSLTRLEYYVDTDPGYGLGHTVNFPSAVAAQDFTYNATLTGVSPGFHTLYTRVQGTMPQQVNPRGPLGPLGANAYPGEANYLPARKTWSQTQVRPVYLGPVNATGSLDNLTYLEYFFDTDPGYRLGYGVAITPGTNVDKTFVADLSTLAPGFHTLYVRVKSASGAWSITTVRPAYVGPSASGTAAANLVFAEYYIDTDPGYGLATRVPFATPGTTVDQTFTADLTNVPNGFHTLYVRVRDAAGAWSLTTVKPFLRSGTTVGTPPPSLTRCEYYIDTDPGYGLATNVPITAGVNVDQTFTADLSSVSNGFHTLYVRVRDASKAWSLTKVQPFLRQGSITGGARPLITRIRYQVFPQGSATASSPPEYYVLPVASRAADVDETFPTNVCVTTAGTYELRVAALDANGVPAIEYVHEFNVSTPSRIDPNLPPLVNACTGQPVTLTSASAGPGGSYLWSTGATTQSISVSTTGDYSVAVTSAQGCTGSDTTHVQFAPAPIVGLPTYTDVPCNQPSVTLDAGPGYASYLWNTGATTQTITASTPGTYSVTVTGAGGGACSGTGSTTVRKPVAQLLQASATQCAGTSTTLTLATPTNGSIAWAANGSPIAGQTSPSLTVAPTATTTYTATVSDGSYSCAANVTLTIPAPLPLNLPDTTYVACGAPASVTLDAGPGGTTYLWSTGATSQTITVTMPGQYSVTVDNGCPKTDQTYVLLPKAKIAPPASTSVCPGTPVTLMLETPINGSIQWSTGATTASITVMPTATTTYTVTVRDHGQVCTDQVTITISSPPVVSLPADSSPACGAGTATLDAGAGATSYLWSTGATTQTITVSTPGTYSVTASNGGCSATGSTAVFLPLASVLGGATQHTCVGQSLTLSLVLPTNGAVLWSTGAATNSITVSPSANTTYSVQVSAGGHTCSASVNVVVEPLPSVTLLAQNPVCVSMPAYALSGGFPVGGTYSGPGVSNNTFNPASAGVGTHTITYTYSAGNNCTGSATQTLTVRPLPTVTLAAQAPVCRETSAFALTGGMPAGGAYSGPGVSNGQFNPATAGVGTHTITYTYADANDCANSASQTLTVLPRPTLSVVPDSLLCPGSTATLTVGTAGAGATYAWSTGATGPSITVGTPAAVGTPDSYSVTVTNAAGCTYLLQQKIYRSPSSTLPLAVIDMLPSDGATGLDLPINFSWNPQAGSTARTFDLYVWPAAGVMPTQPTVAGINTLQYSYSGPLPYGAAYKWRVVARNTCGSTPGSIQTFELRQLPDLQVTLVQNPDTAYSSQTVHVTWNVTNTGPGSTLAQQWQDVVYFSQNSVFDNTAVRMGSVGNATYLQPNGTYINQGTFNVPLSMAGLYYVYVVADGDNQVLETNNNNNTGAGTKRTRILVPTAPDLIVQQVSHNSSIFGGDTLLVVYRVRNAGSVAVAASWTDAGYVSPDTVQNISQNTGPGILGPGARRVIEKRKFHTLLPNQTYQDTLYLPVPHTFYGKYFVYVFTDDANEVFELASTNNVNPRLLVPRPNDPTHHEYVPITVFLRPPPDLRVNSVTAPATATAGTPINLGWEVQNYGANKPFPRLETYWGDAVYLCPSATFDPATAIGLGTTYHYNGTALDYNAPNNKYTASAMPTLPNGISGSYYVYVFTDSGNQVFEYDKENNNDQRSPQPVNINLVYADLHPTALTAPATLSAPNSFSVSYTVQNTTAAIIPASGTWFDRITAIDANGTSAVLGDYPHAGPLAVGADYSNTVTVTLPPYLVPGQVTLRIDTNGSGSVYEFNLGGNNSQTTTFTYLYSDDLAVSNLTATPAAFSGQNITASWRVDNLGTFTTLATSWSDQLYLSVDNVLDGSDLQLAAPGNTSALAPGGFYTRSQTVTLPQGLSGSYYLLVRTANYPNGTLADTNPANNVTQLALPITLTTPADLRIVTTTGQAPVTPAYAQSGQQMHVQFQVRNYGPGATPAAAWNDGIYLNTSSGLSGATRIGVVSHGGVLASNGDYLVDEYVTVPGYLAAGSYYLLLSTDNNDPSGYGPQTSFWGGATQVGLVYEHQQEGNNTYLVPTTVTVTLPQPADLIVQSVTVPTTTKLGKTLTVSYTVKNQGSADAVGLLKDGAYLSQGRTPNTSVDPLFGTNTRNLTIAPGAVLGGTIRARVQGLLPGNYHGSLATNLFHDIYETNYQNDTLSQVAATAVDVNVLPLNVTVPFALDRDSLEFYKVTPGANVDLLVKLGSNKNFGQNEVYVGYNRVPTASSFDFIYDDPINTRQELLIPSTGPGDYYIMVRTPTLFGGQTATLRAEALPFQVRSIAKDTVGQGRVTTRVLGAGFRKVSNTQAATKFYLTAGSNPANLATAEVVAFRSSVEVTLRWHLENLPTGNYNVVADNGGTLVQLSNGLHVVANSGQVVNFASITPPVLAVETPGDWTYFLTNSSNVDLPYWEFQFEVPVGSGPVVTHTPNVRKKSDFRPAVSNAGLANDYADASTDVIPFVARDLRPGEVIQVNLHMTPPISYSDLVAAGGTVHFPVVLNQQPASEAMFTRRTLDFIARYKAAVLASPGQFAPGVVALAQNPSPTAWTDSLTRYYLGNGLVDASKLPSPPRVRYTQLNRDTHVPGGVASDYWRISEQYHEFRPDPFSSTGYPAPLSGAADSVRFAYNSRGANSTAIIAAIDPNLLTGPDGYGPKKMVGIERRSNYQVQFENDRLRATGPAQRVRVNVSLDQTVSLNSFRLGDFGFNGQRYAVPDGATTYSNTIDLSSTLGYKVRVLAGLDVVGRQAFWEFQTLDPATNQTPTDPLRGFLPVSDTLGNGHGFLNYTILAGGIAVTGDSLRAQASIVFDNSTPLKTNRWGNIVDAGRPVSAFTSVVQQPGATPSFALTWTGSDDQGGSGVAFYDVFAAENNQPFRQVASGITSTTYTFTGNPGSTYRFFTLATDNTGNREAAKQTGNAAAPLPVELLSFAARRQGSDVRLSWQTASERNSAWFVVQATADPLAGFQEIGRVAAAGSSLTLRSYAFTERNVPMARPLRYYRLHQLDLDGKDSYSPVVVVPLDATDAPLTLQAYPNPFYGPEFSALITAPETLAGVELSLYDLTGRLLSQQVLTAPAGVSSIRLAGFADLPTGVYVLRLKAGSEVRQVRVEKQ